MYAYTKPEAEVPKTTTEVLADDLHSAVAFANLRDTVAMQQRQIDVLKRTTEQLSKDVLWLTNSLREIATIASAVGGAQ